jgi:hypothetical protein
MVKSGAAAAGGKVTRCVNGEEWRGQRQAEEQNNRDGERATHSYLKDTRTAG